MKITLKKSRDLLTPDIRAKLAKSRAPRKTMEAIGLVVVSMEQRAYTQTSLRPSTWAPLKPATLKAKKRAGYGSKPLVSSGTLARSSRVISTTNQTVSVGSDRRVGTHSLAAIHQHGTKDGRIPARPTWPFGPDGKPTDRARKNILTAARRSLDSELL